MVDIVAAYARKESPAFVTTTSYDVASVMHYGFDACSRPLAGVIPPDAVPGAVTGQVSDGDREAICQLYRCGIQVTISGMAPVRPVAGAVAAVPPVLRAWTVVRYLMSTSTIGRVTDQLRRLFAGHPDQAVEWATLDMTTAHTGTVRLGSDAGAAQPADRLLSALAAQPARGSANPPTIRLHIVRP